MLVETISLQCYQKPVHCHCCVLIHSANSHVDGMRGSYCDDEEEDQEMVMDSTGDPEEPMPVPLKLFASATASSTPCSKKDSICSELKGVIVSNGFRNLNTSFIDHFFLIIMHISSVAQYSLTVQNLCPKTPFILLNKHIMPPKFLEIRLNST